ncbi:MAG: NAD(P)/FAD-dependent oxidoreductase [Bacteroidetes bacterium]|nr:MAG: NAD(P)/FAD-dependent oxidoreductase [Bacteroidota bacterium]MBL1146006.1 NAD(P)/FAD-dependent oxidoreductase [Bacteroidota bacterium]MCB0802091.1 NAD(P)/FAD-dependent oxidoreductase [Flavobacteriales bacterium]NOG58800.1 NAD(P)/FAD-dependent oxidoreductase [Bacteroidota bacterium]
MDKYDLCVIGGGPAGYAAAMRAIDFGKRVLLVEKAKLGGYGIYDGALASKTMWELSTRIKTVKEEIGQDKRMDISFSKVKEIINEALFERKFQLSCHLRIIHAETGLINYEKGTASFVSAHEVKVTKDDGSSFIVYAENTIIASGSRPRTLPNIKVDEKTILTSDGILHLDKFPKSLVILGAGIIGCEFATMFSNFGQTKVYLIDKADRILPFEDQDVADVVATNLEENGVVIHKGSQLIRMEQLGDIVEYEIENSDGTREVLQVEKAMLSIGRVSNVEQLNLENAGVKMNTNGVHIIDEDTRTNIPNIYSVGDVSGHLALVNVGEREARHAVVRIFADFPVKPIRYENISTIMFLNPEVAAVGINEQIAAEMKIPIRVSKVDYSTIARAIAMRKTNGFFKIIVSDDDEMKVLGMRAVGEHASSAIQAMALLIYMDKGIDEIAHMIHPHPSIVEGIQECVRMLIGKSVYKSSIFKDKLKCYRRTVGGEILPLHEELTSDQKNLERV